MSLNYLMEENAANYVPYTMANLRSIRADDMSMCMMKFPAEPEKQRRPRSFEIDFRHVESGVDLRKSIIIRDIPQTYTQLRFLKEIVPLIVERLNNMGIDGNDPKYRIEFCYLPYNMRKRQSNGYCFLAVSSLAFLEVFYDVIHGYRCREEGHTRVCKLAYSRVQGTRGLVAQFNPSIILALPVSYQPVIARDYFDYEYSPEIPNDFCYYQNVRHQSRRNVHKKNIYQQNNHKLDSFEGINVEIPAENTQVQSMEPQIPADDLNSLLQSLAVFENDTFNLSSFSHTTYPVFSPDTQSSGNPFKPERTESRSSTSIPGPETPPPQPDMLTPGLEDEDGMAAALSEALDSLQGVDMPDLLRLLSSVSLNS